MPPRPGSWAMALTRVEMGPVISAASKDRIEMLIGAGAAEGATLPSTGAAR